MADEPAAPDPRAQLKDLSAKATQAYGRKEYEKAAEFYSQACELQDEIHGEMAVENADLLYAYGRCLYHVGVSKSDVLGGKAPDAGQSAAGKKRKRGTDAPAAPVAEEKAPSVLEASMKQSEAPPASAPKEPNPNGKPFFDISGDAAGWDSDEDDDDDAEDGPAAGDDGEEDEDDDFATSYEILDMARRLFEKRIGQLQGETGKGKGKAADESLELRQTKEKLADTHDLQSEISLENERFADAIADSRANLALKQDLETPHSRLLAEAYFKLSLALEFASMTTEKGAGDEEAQVDEGMRAEAAAEMEHAIGCLKLHIAVLADEVKAASGAEKEKKVKAEKDVVEMIAEMETRLEDLRLPAASLRVDPSTLLGGMVDPAAQAAAQDKVAQAQDISSLIRPKKKQEGTAPAASGSGSKRAAEDDDAASTSSKKAKVEGAP